MLRYGNQLDYSLNFERLDLLSSFISLKVGLGVNNHPGVSVFSVHYRSQLDSVTYVGNMTDPDPLGVVHSPVIKQRPIPEDDDPYSM